MSAWSTVIVTVGSDTVSNDVIDIDIWHEDHFYVARCEILLLNDNNEWFTDFDVADAVSVSVDGVELFNGFLDDIVEDTNDDSASLNTMTLKCRGQGFNLSNIYYTHNYPDYTYKTASDIIFHSLSDSQTGLDEAEKITYSDYVTPNSVPTLACKFNRSYLLDKYRDICEQINYSGYVTNGADIKFFAQGAAAQHTDVDLVLDDNVGASNILRFKWGEQVGYNIRNYIEVYAGGLKDHWTDCVDGDGDGDNLIEDIDGNLIFTAGTNTSTPTAEFTYKLPRGLLSVECHASANPTGTASFELILEFPKFNYTSLNLSQTAENSVWVHHTLDLGDLITNRFRCSPRLRDTNGNVIEYAKTGQFATIGNTHDLPGFYWNEIKFPQGADLRIGGLTGQTTGYWSLIEATDTIAVPEFTNAVIDAEYAIGGKNYGRIDFNGGTFVPSNVWVPNMVVTISDAEDLSNVGNYTVKTVGASYVIFWETLGDDNAEDTDIEFISGFDWYHVDKVSFYFTYTGEVDEIPNCYVDYLTMPTVEVISIQESAASSLLYKKRMFRENHSELTNQNAVDNLAESMLEVSKDPLSTVKLWANGQTGSLYAGQSLDLQAVPYGISSLTKYRITKLHHIIKSKEAVLGGYNFATEYDLIEHTVGGFTQYTNMGRLLSIYDPQSYTIDSLSKYREILQQDDNVLDVHTYSRIPNDNELQGLGLTGLYADIPASAATDTFYYATDTMIWYRWTGSAWVESTRAEVKSRLAQLAERAHSNTSGIGADDHHNQSHDSRHATSGGADALDTANATGSHTHGIAVGTTPVTVVSGNLVNYYLATGVTQHESGYWVMLDYEEVSTPTQYHTHSINSTSDSGGGSHSHNVTASPTPDVEIDEDNPMITIVKDEYNVDGTRKIIANFTEFGREETIEYPSDRTDAQILKSLKQRWHDLWEHKKKVDSNIIKANGELNGKKIKWDRDKERNHLIEQTVDDGRSGWRTNMEKSMKEGTLTSSVLVLYVGYEKERDKKRKELKLDSSK